MSSWLTDHQLIAWLIAHVLLVIFNLVNSRIDAYRILKNKTIAHGINFGAYALFTGAIIWAFHYGIYESVLFAVSAFCNRQFSFDLSLNKRRGVKWDYVSPAKPPKALMDRIEIRLFGYNGKAPYFMYGAVWIICTLIKWIWL